MQSFVENFWGFMLAIFGAFLTACWWFIRNVLTDKHRITALETENTLRAAQREIERGEDLAMMREMREDIKAISRAVTK